MSKDGAGESRSRTPRSLRLFGEAAAAVWHSDMPDSFWDCEPAFSSLVASDFLSELLHCQLDAYLEYDASPDIQCGTSGYAQLDLPGGLQLDVVHLDEGHCDDILQSHPCDMLMGFRSDDPAAFVAIDRYEYPGHYRNEVFDPQTPLVSAGLTRLEPCRVQRIEAGKTAFRISDVGAGVMLLLLKSPARMDFSWSYDRDTLKSVAGVVPYLPAYRLFFATRLLGQIPRRRSLDNLETLSRHTAHFVRWTAIQSMFSIDFDVAVTRLKLAAETDGHPSIRKAARSALDQLTGD